MNTGAIDLSVPASPPHADAIACGLAGPGWIVVDGFLDGDHAQALARDCHALDRSSTLRAASIGHGSERHRSDAVRGDRTCWLDPGGTTAQRDLLARLEALRLALNRALYLNLVDVESHFALYPPGACYARHLDCFHDDDRRVVSFVCYLNEDWRAADAGELRIDTQLGTRVDVLPLSGRVVAFLSAEHAHEVLPATRERLSIAGWFRRR